MDNVIGSRTSRGSHALGAALLIPALALLGAGPVHGEEPTEGTSLQMVTLRTPGTAGSARPSEELLVVQEDVLQSVSSPAPEYQWTTALNGFAARLTPSQAEQLRADPRVALVEPNSLRQMTAAPASPAVSPAIAQMRSNLSAKSRRAKGGAGTVVGVVDSGIWPESPLFADTPGLGRAPKDFTGSCELGEDWDSNLCQRKLVGANWFVAGFGEDRLASTESLSARDDAGHGTQVASIAAGNGGVSISGDPHNAGVFSGIAPQARLAVYKACWSAPDPADDGCATADLVSAIDRATSDGVDILNLSVMGAPDFDTVSHALLGAAEADVVVIGAAGNDADAEYAGYAAPWTTTVGGLAKRARYGKVEVTGGPSLVGASRALRATTAPLVLAGSARAPGVSLAAARQCRPDSLDAATVQGATVVCMRGGVGRIDKSEVVRRADGVAMVLVNQAGSGVFADVHSVPTIHLAARPGARLVRHLRKHPRTEGRLAPLTASRVRLSTARWSASGNPAGPLVKPDLVAPATGVLAAVPATDSRRWSTLTGTSAAAAHVTGLAAMVRAKHPDWDATTVRSALSTSAAAVRDGSSPLRQGAGRVREQAPAAPGLAFQVKAGDYRAWLAGNLTSRDLNTPSILVGSTGTITRRVTNVGSRAMYYSSRADGFAHYDVRVEPAAIRLRPGQSTTFRVIIESGQGGLPRADDGTITWLGAQGTTVRVPVVVTR